MNNTVCHIIGLDEIHKKNLIKQLIPEIKIIDLDNIQQIVYNHKDLIKQKIIWDQLSNNINIKQKQKKLIESKQVGTGIDIEIKKLVAKRNMTKKNVYNLWKNKISELIEEELSTLSDDKKNIIFVGFNVFPKDYRIRVNISLPVPSMIDRKLFFNKILYDVNPQTYAANQIKYYLYTYTDRIIKGTFPLDLLKTDYLVNKYEKFSSFYEKLGYVPVYQKDLIPIIQKLNHQLSTIKEIIRQNVFVATKYRSGKSIPVNTKTPIEGFITKEEAVNNIQTKLKKNVPIYIYEIEADQFNIIDGKLFATQTLYPLNEESHLLTI